MRDALAASPRSPFRKPCARRAREIFRPSPIDIGQNEDVAIDEDCDVGARRPGLFAGRYAKLSFSAVVAGSTGWMLFGSAAQSSNGVDVSNASAQTVTDTETAEPPDVAEALSRGAEPTVPSRWSDATIGAAIHKRLQWDTSLDTARIEVTVDDATVALSGSVATPIERERAIAAVWVAGVQDVDAEGLDVVAPRRAPKLSAARIERSIVTALAVDPTIAGATIDVRVHHGQAVLRGTVDNLASARAAVLVARHAPGISVVVDEITVAAWSDDEEIAADVAAALRETPETAALGVEVRCDRGAVVLEGAVEVFAQRVAAEHVAAEIHGVQTIDNRLGVVAGEVAFYYDPHDYGFRPAAEIHVPFSDDAATKDERIESAIEAELALSRWVDAARIEVSVKGGTATLTGEVDTITARSAAIRNAHEGGASTVVDRLVVTGDAKRPASSSTSRAGEAIFGRDD